MGIVILLTLITIATSGMLRLFGKSPGNLPRTNQLTFALYHNILCFVKNIKLYILLLRFDFLNRKYILEEKTGGFIL